MTLELASLEHTLNQLGREASDLFADFSCIFIPYHKGQEDAALAKKAATFHVESALAEFFKHLEAHKTDAIIKISRRPFPYLFTKEKHVAAIFVDLGEMTSSRLNLYEDDPQKHYKFMALKYFWHALSLRQALKNDKSTLERFEHGIFAAPKTILTLLRQNLLSDSFASSAMELTGNKGSVKLLQKRRADLCVSKEWNYAPEAQPFPITFDSLKLVLRHARDAQNEDSVLEKALTITEETSEIFDDIALEKWAEFALKVQDMIWTERTITETLGCAAYSTEDPYIRSYASILGDMLSTDISPTKSTDSYNPFGAQESLEALHLKYAEQHFTDLIAQMFLEENPDLLIESANAKNERLLSGHILGWSSPALIEAARSYKDSAKDLGEAAEKIHRTFYKTLKKTPWTDLTALHTLIVTLLRESKATPRNLKERLEKSETLSYLSEYI